MREGLWDKLKRVGKVFKKAPLPYQTPQEPPKEAVEVESIPVDKLTRHEGSQGYISGSQEERVRFTKFNVWRRRNRAAAKMRRAQRVKHG